MKLPSGRAMVWIGAGMVFFALAILILAPKMWHPNARSVFSLAVPAMLLSGLLIEIIGIFRRANAAARLLAEHNYSVCSACGYPFDGDAEETKVVVCSECGKHFVAGEARAWNKHHPERVPKS